jgi:hypothetical protein
LGAFDINKRLGRGKTYANTGKVLSINIQRSQVSFLFVLIIANAASNIPTWKRLLTVCDNFVRSAHMHEDLSPLSLQGTFLIVKIAD